MHSRLVSRFFSSSINRNNVVIVAAKRTATGLLLGKLSKIKPTLYAGELIKNTLAGINLQGNQVNEVLLGNVVSAGLGQAPARQASRAAGLPDNIPCTTINKMCASGLKTVTWGAQTIALGENNVVVAGGFEGMSHAPFYVMNHRRGNAYGSEGLVDGLAYDGLTDVYDNIPMGLCAEKTAKELKIDRNAQDEFCIASYERLIAAHKSGIAAKEIVPLTVEKGEQFAQDEELSKYKKDKIPQLKPAFDRKSGTITAGNASKINDGAACIVLMNEEFAKKNGFKPLARIINYADAETTPIDFCISPAQAVQKCLEKAGKTSSHVQYHEINEAFSVTVLANMQLLKIPHDKVNIHGGAVALGHPIGASGARILVSLISVLKEKKAQYGMASICNGGGGSTACLIENIEQWRFSEAWISKKKLATK